MPSAARINSQPIGTARLARGATDHRIRNSFLLLARLWGEMWRGIEGKG